MDKEGDNEYNSRVAEGADLVGTVNWGCVGGPSIISPFCYLFSEVFIKKGPFWCQLLV